MGLALVLAIAAGQIARGPAEDVLVFVGPARVTLREPVIIDVTLRNEADEPLEIDLGLSDVTNYEFQLQAPDGTIRRLRPEGRDGIQALGGWTVPARRMQAHWIVLSEWFAITQHGNYALGIRFVGSATRRGRAAEISRSSLLEFEVLPSNDEALRQTCRRLAEGVRDPVVDRSQRSVRALSTIIDPIAAPFLADAAEFDPSPSVEMRTLVRIGGPEAVAALERLTRNPDPVKARMAKGSLEILARR